MRGEGREGGRWWKRRSERDVGLWLSFIYLKYEN